jgi:periplasmic mercuric ion binding protein
MRSGFVLLSAVVMAAGLSAGALQAGKVEVKGVHLCCGMCVKGVAGALKGVDGVADAKCDQKGKTVTFTTKDDKTTAAALKALTDAGYFGDATDDGKAVKLDAGKAEGKANDVTVKGVHVCCKQCENAIAALLKDGKVTYTGTGAIKDLKVSGKDLDKAKVLESLQKGGFTGKVE